MNIKDAYVHVGPSGTNEKALLKDFAITAALITLTRAILNDAGTGDKTETITIPTWNQSTTGNAATATKLATARTISLTGSVTGSGTFDGSGNLSIATTTNHSHDYLYSIQTSAAQTTVSWAIETAKTVRRGFIYNTSSTEYSYLFGLSSSNTTIGDVTNNATYGAVLKMGYADKYLRILRVHSGKWYKPDNTLAALGSIDGVDWEKISAGYADLAGSVAWSGVTGIPYIYTFNTTEFSYDPATRKITCIGGANANSWDKQIYSKIGYKECKLTYHIGLTDKYIMVGLNSDPATDASYSSIDYCWYTQANGSLSIYESSSSIGSISGHTTYAVGDELSIEYSDGVVRYYHNGVLCRSVDRTYGSLLYFDSSFYNVPGGNIYDVTFEPIGIKSVVNIYGDQSINGYKTFKKPIIINSDVNNNYNEGIRIQDTGNKWAGITLGATGILGIIPLSGEVAWFVAKNPGGKFSITPDTSTSSTGLELTKNGNAKWRNNIILHSGNYTSYAVAAWTAKTDNVNYPIAFSPNATPATSGNGYNTGFTFNPGTKTFNNNGCRLQYDSTNKVLKFIFD